MAKNKSNLRKFAIVSFVFSFWLGFLIYAWMFISPETKYIAEGYIIGWIIGELALIYYYLDISVLKGIASIERLPVVTKSPENTIIAAIATILILYISLDVIANVLSMDQHPFTMIQLFSISDPAGKVLLIMPLALLIVGYVMPSTEEGSLFGSWVRPSLQETAEQLGIDKSRAFSLSFLGSAFLFAFFFHLVITNIRFDVAAPAFLLRIILDLGNLRFGYLYGAIIHSFINSFIVGVVIFGLGWISWWLIPPILVIAPSLIFPKRAVVI